MSCRSSTRGRADLAQVRLRLLLAADGHDLVAATGQHVDRQAADAAGRTGDDDGTVRGLLPFRSIWCTASAAVKPAVPSFIESSSVSPAQRNHPVAFDARKFGVNRRRASHSGRSP